MAADNLLHPDQFPGWESAYNNSAEELYPGVFHPASGKPLRDLTQEEDEAVVAHATRAMRATS